MCLDGWDCGWVGYRSTYELWPYTGPAGVEAGVSLAATRRGKRKRGAFFSRFPRKKSLFLTARTLKSICKGLCLCLCDSTSYSSTLVVYSLPLAISLPLSLRLFFENVLAILFLFPLLSSLVLGGAIVSLDLCSFCLVLVHLPCWLYFPTFLCFYGTAAAWC